MEFFTVGNLKRPIRLSEKTRKFAYDSLQHVYGLDTEKNYAIPMDNEDGFSNMSDIDKYDFSIRKVAESAPIRICENELISGAATFGMAIIEAVPVSINNKWVLGGVSHLTVDFESVLKKGINGIKRDVEASLSKHTEPDKIRFLKSCLSVLESFKIWHGRYLKALKEKGYEANYNNLLNVPFEPADNYYEAVQSIWFTFAFLRLCGNWPGIGRIDYLLGDYLKKDIEKGVQTIESAREIMAHFFIKGCEWFKGGTDYYGGDAQHYQNLVLSGIDENGNDITNDVTYLVLDVIEEFGISDFPTTVRLNSKTDTKLYKRLAEVLRYGGGILAFYNEDLIIDSIIKYGYPKCEAWKFANDGCWEVQIPGKTYFTYMPFDSLGILQKKTLKSYDDSVCYADFESLYSEYVKNLYEELENIYLTKEELFLKSDKDNPVWKKGGPCTVVSILEQGCIEKGLSYVEGGPVYNITSPHIGGLPDTVNGLYTIKKIVFDEKKLSFTEFMNVLKNNWDGYEKLRREILNEYSFYGNDNDECDEIAVRLLADFAKGCKKLDGRCGYSFPPGVSTFGRQLLWNPDRLASPHGHKIGDILAPNCSPTPNSDKQGATAILRSYCKADLTEMVTGAALDIKLLASSVEGDDGIDAIVSLLKGFVPLGGYFVQPDVQDKEILKEAQKNPDDYSTLSVRVSGWNARFVTLTKDWQDMIINENK